jgi:formylglycine-generating enzyme
MHALVTGRLDRYAALKEEDGGLLTQAFALAPEAFRERMAKAVAGSPEETYRFARTTGAVDTGKSVENLRAVGDEDYEDWLFETTHSLRLSAAFELCERLAHGAGRNRITVNVWDGSLLAYVPAGMSEMGDGQDADCPKHRVELSAYWIGIYAVTNAQYLKFVRATGHRAPDKADYGEAVWKNGRFSAEKADHPVVCVSWDDAVAYARWAGCRLPTEAEWEKAARGRAGLLYPWGNDWDEAKCRHAKNWWGSETTCAVYGYSSGVSGYGTYNQSGNVWEWCSDWYGGDYYQASPAGNPRGPETGSLRVSRGGCWGNDDPGRFRAANRRRVVPDLRSGYLGFLLARAAS